MKNLFLIPTIELSNLLLCIKDYIEHEGSYAENSDSVGNLRLGVAKYADNAFYQSQYIYITNSEEIKKRDAYITKNGEVCKNDGSKILLKNHLNKIILTTDPDLIKDGVQAIDDEFIKWFVKNPRVEEVKVIFGLFTHMGRQVDPNDSGQNHSKCVWKYKIIIPKEMSNNNPTVESVSIGEEVVDIITYEPFYEESKEVETLEEAIIRLTSDEEDVSKRLSGAYYITKGAKWQQEQDKKLYSEEEVLNITQQLRIKLKSGVLKWQDDFEFDLEEWVAQFKK